MASGDEDDDTIVAISEEDARTILTNQVNTVNHLQSQGLGTLRVIFAVIAILATVTITGIDYPVSPFESQYTAVRANSTVNTTDIPALTIGGSIVGSVFTFISSSLIAGILLIHGFSKLYGLISPTQLQPGLGTSGHIISASLEGLYQNKYSSAQILEYR